MQLENEAYKQEVHLYGQCWWHSYHG